MKNVDEIYFDVIEYFDYKEDKYGNTISSMINGEIRVDNLLTGINHIYMEIKNHREAQDFALHECALQ